MSTLTLSKIKKIGCLSKGEQMFLDDIVFLSKQEGYCWASVSKLSERNEISERSVKRYVRKLVNLGLLTEKFIYGKNASHIIGRTLTVVAHKVWDLINFYTEQAKKKQEEKKNKYSMSAYVQQQREKKQQSASQTQTQVQTKTTDEEVEPQQAPVNPFEAGIPNEQRLEEVTGLAENETINVHTGEIVKIKPLSLVVEQAFTSVVGFKPTGDVKFEVEKLVAQFSADEVECVYDLAKKGTIEKPIPHLRSSLYSNSKDGSYKRWKAKKESQDKLDNLCEHAKVDDSYYDENWMYDDIYNYN